MLWGLCYAVFHVRCRAICRVGAFFKMNRPNCILFSRRNRPDTLIEIRSSFPSNAPAVRFAPKQSLTNAYFGPESDIFFRDYFRRRLGGQYVRNY
jgi:hypothetical protein